MRFGSPGAAGSSPPAWGTLVLLLPCHHDGRFIPTRVGNTAPVPLTFKFASVHPHPRGEHAFNSFKCAAYFGSSPPAWGTLYREPRPISRLRFIPTRVGNTCECRDRYRRMAVHPHPRGEHSTEIARRTYHLRFIPTRVGNTSGTKGKSSGRTVHPHPRGEHAWAKIKKPYKERFIPTRVGNTSAIWATQFSSPVHPHPRGEHCRVTVGIANHPGSSPPAWGTRVKSSDQMSGQRFIPTRVGNTNEQNILATASAVHPHPRGEHSSPAAFFPTRNGSSPPAWGTLRRFRPTPHHHRFIPTRVGNTSYTPLSTSRSSVHPHPRGEHFVIGDMLIKTFGSSPPAWGTLVI